MGQEPGTDAEIKARVLSTYSITWPLFSKIEVNGPSTHPVYKFLRSANLKNQTPEKNDVDWNFAKFIVSRNGQVERRYGPGVDPSTFDAPEKMPAWLATPA